MQQCLLTLSEKWKNTVDKSALLTDLSKAFGCLNHEVLITKLTAYCLTLSTLKLTHNYLPIKQKTKRTLHKK